METNTSHSPFTSKGYPFRKDFSSYNTYDMGRAFFSDGHVDKLHAFQVFDHVTIFNKALLKDETLYYKKSEIPVTIYTTNPLEEITDKYNKLEIDYDEIAIFFFKENDNIKAKINLGDSLLKLSNFDDENQMGNQTFDISLEEIQRISNNLSAKNIVSFFNKDYFLFNEDVENITGLFEKPLSISDIQKKYKEFKVLYETDGHYSTVYLVCLMLGMDRDLSKKLATATEAPDTNIHSETKFELNDTWGHTDGSQQDIHSLTGGFHGIEEFFTAVKFLYTPKNDIKTLGELLHRFGDTYAHTEINNLKPDDIKESKELKDADEKMIKEYIESWKIESEITLGSKVEPWLKFFNYYMKEYGIEFLESEKKQKQIFKGKTLKETLKDIYLTNKSADFIMYGSSGYTSEHAFTDGGYPDMIYLRPNWYYIYVQNLAWIISNKFSLDYSKLDLTLFDKMLSFLKKNEDKKPSMKGIIDYEIAKFLGNNHFYIPVYYADGRFLASVDAVQTDYLQIAQNVKNLSIKYIKEQGILNESIKIEEIKNWFKPKVNKNGFFVIEAFKITFKK